MKPKHTEQQQDSLEILANINASVRQDFHTLSSTQVCKLLEVADIRKYRKPKHANGSRGRYFYALVQRRAKGERQ